MSENANVTVSAQSEAPKKKVMLSGIQPSGDLHLGNYLGAIKNWGARSEEFDCYYFMADLHTITVRQEPAELRRILFSSSLRYLHMPSSDGCSSAIPCSVNLPE